MLFKTLKKLVKADIEKYGHISEDLEEKINVFYATGKITEAQYRELLSID